VLRRSVGDVDVPGPSGPGRTLFTNSPEEAFAVTPAERECTQAGGTYSFSQGTSSCTFATNPSRNDNPNAAKPFKQADTKKGQGQGGGEETNPNATEGPVTNPGGGTPPGQQP
jgi:hypothetical protein